MQNKGDYYSEEYKEYEITIEPMGWAGFDVGVYKNKSLIKPKIRVKTFAQAMEVYYQELTKLKNLSIKV